MKQSLVIVIGLIILAVVMGGQATPILLQNGWLAGTVIPSGCSSGNSPTFYDIVNSFTYTCKGNKYVIDGLNIVTTTLTNNSATPLFTVPLDDPSNAGGQVFYTIIVASATARQSHSGVATWAFSRVGASYADSVHESAQLESMALTSGTLTDTWAGTAAAGVGTVTLNVNSNLSGITLEVIRYAVNDNGGQVITYK